MRPAFTTKIFPSSQASPVPSGPISPRVTRLNSVNVWSLTSAPRSSFSKASRFETFRKFGIAGWIERSAVGCVAIFLPRSQTLFGNANVWAVTQPERARPGFPTLFPPNSETEFRNQVRSQTEFGNEGNSAMKSVPSAIDRGNPSASSFPANSTFVTRHSTLSRWISSSTTMAVRSALTQSPK
jgi:hypothetical protein